MSEPSTALTPSNKPTALNNLHSLCASIMRVPRGLFVHPHCRRNPPRPEVHLELYEFEGCPFCRKVRDALTRHDLEFISRPTPQGDLKKRAVVQSRCGKTSFPYLVDPNTDTELFESEDIITYLYQTYGPGRSTLNRISAPIDTISSFVASAIRPRGARVQPGLENRLQPDQLLVLYGFENSPFCRKVRETLNELNLDYLTKNVGRGSQRRQELIDRGGKMMVPYLIDPNTDTELYESNDIVAYLYATYGAL